MENEPPINVELVHKAPKMDNAQILCVMRLPPNVDGFGGSQRAWHLVQALRSLGDIHFVLLFRSSDRDCVEASLSNLETICASISRIEIKSWNPSPKRKFGLVPGGLWDMARLGSQDAPRLSAREARAVALQLPVRNPAVIFAGRLSCAFMVQQLIDKNLVSATLRIVDFDDLMSKFNRRRVEISKLELRLQSRLRGKLEANILQHAETKIIGSWDGIGLSSKEDVSQLRQKHPARLLAMIPNVVMRERLPARDPDGVFRIVFTGLLSYEPNFLGLAWFVDEALPILRKKLPAIELIVVGMSPTAPLIELSKKERFSLHPNAASLKPFYQDCDAVIAPILHASGTRIKILEAMAYGRTVVSTTAGAEGIGLIPNQHFLQADDMEKFAQAIVRLAENRILNQALAAKAHEYQQHFYTPEAMKQATLMLVGDARRRQVDLGDATVTRRSDKL